MKVIWLILSLAVPAIAAPPAQPITLTAGPHLFVDDYLISHQEHLERVLNQPVRLPAPIVTSAEDKNFQPSVSVVRDPQTRRVRMWYDAPADPPKNHPSRLSYLESEDGVAWIRPHRVLENPGGLEMRFGASVFDEGPGFRDPARRFKPGWCWGDFTVAAPGGLMVATSPDGFAWTPVSAKPPALAHDHDINNIFFDPIRKRYLATVSNMVPAPNGGGKRRQPFQSTSDDLVHWSEPWLTPSIPGPPAAGKPLGRESNFLAVLAVSAGGRSAAKPVRASAGSRRKQQRAHVLRATHPSKL